MRKQRRLAIDQAIAGLAPALGGVRPAVSLDNATLKKLYVDKDYAGMIAVIRKDMGVHVRIRFGLVKNNAGPQGPAWIERPQVDELKRHGLKHLVVTIYIREKFLQSGFEETVLAIAHELSHLVLDLIDHRWRKHEKAVDLTAMILGYRAFYLRTTRKSRLGYFSPEEVEYAYFAIEERAKTVPDDRAESCSPLDYLTKWVRRMLTRFVDIVDPRGGRG